jgi:hypothetical protein
MPRRRLRPLIVLSVCGAAMMLLGWCGSIGYFSSVNAPDESLSLWKASRLALTDIVQARKEHRVSDAHYRAAVVVAHEIDPLRAVLKETADAREANRWNPLAAYRYSDVRTRFIRLLEQLENLRDTIPTTRPA